VRRKSVDVERHKIVGGKKRNVTNFEKGDFVRMTCRREGVQKRCCLRCKHVCEKGPDEREREESAGEQTTESGGLYNSSGKQENRDMDKKKRASWERNSLKSQGLKSH